MDKDNNYFPSLIILYKIYGTPMYEEDKETIIMRIQWIYMMIISFLAMFNFLLDPVMEYTDLVESTEALVVAFMIFNSILKNWGQFYHRNITIKAFTRLRSQMAAQSTEKWKMDILIDAEKKVRKIRNGFLYIFFSVLTAATLEATHSTFVRGVIKTPLRMWLPVDQSHGSGFVFGFFYDVVISCHGIIIFSMGYNTFCSMIIYARAQADILKKSLNVLQGFQPPSLNTSDSNHSQIPIEGTSSAGFHSTLESLNSMTQVREHSLKECAFLHAYIIEMVNDINRVYGDALILEIIISSLQSCMVLFQCSKTSFTDAKVITLISLLLCTTTMPLSICWCGQLVRSIGEEIRESIYDVNWYEVNPKVRKGIISLQIQANKLMSLNARGMFHIDISTFMMTMQTAYSYFTLLRTMDS